MNFVLSLAAAIRQFVQRAVEGHHFLDLDRASIRNSVPQLINEDPLYFPIMVFKLLSES